MAAAIQVEQLSRVYVIHEGGLRKQRREISALKQVSLAVQRGEVFGLLGPNGAGKTTLVKILATLLLPSGGRASVLGYDVATQANAVRRRIGLVFGGERGLYNRLSVRDNLAYWATLYQLPRAASASRVAVVLDLLQLGPVADRPVEALSRGMRQRLHLARGLLPDPQVLLLDEPTIGLDPVGARALRAVIHDLRRGGMTIFLTTHYMPEAEELCDRVAIIDHGAIRYEGTPTQLKEQVADVQALQLVLRGCDQGRLRAIADWPAVRSLESEERDGQCRVALTYQGDTTFIGQLVRALDGVEIAELHNREQTLEDAYVSIIGDRGLALGEG